MPTIKNKLTATTVSVGCGNTCRKLSLSKIFQPKPIKHRLNHNHHNPQQTRFYYATNTCTCFDNLPHPHQHHDSASASTSRTTTPAATTTTLSPNISVQGVWWLGSNCLAVEKDSTDPYVDFRDSMLQMIMEKEICGKDDLRELLNCFLQLNSPSYHPIIVGAFTEVCNNLSN
ncbi:uncharacterized protein LOC143538833 [Bidens hawaiensis]|uniref:uncharacterized protein LOC143538833 n=1 Tax=Bidens hawaiensis TaxID=980011 RepID=UPI00404B6969